MRHVRGLDDPRDFQFDVFRVDAVEQPDPTAEQHRGEVDLQLFHEPSLDDLLNCVRAASDPDVLVARGLLRLPYGALDAVGDKGMSYLLA